MTESNLPLWMTADGAAEHLRALGGRLAPAGTKITGVADRPESRLGTIGRRPVIVEESKPGAAIPEYSVRRDRVLRDPERVMIFTDAAHSSFVWACVADRTEYAIYREYSVPRGPLEGLAQRSISEMLIHPEMMHEIPSAIGFAADLPRSELDEVWFGVAGAVTRRLSGYTPAGRRLAARVMESGSSHSALLNCIGTCEDSSEITAVWRALTGEAPPRSASLDSRGLALLDPRCGTGDWLLAALAALEPIYLSCLDRARSLLSDLARDRRRFRPEKLGVLKRLITDVDAELDTSSVTPIIYIRRRIIRANLFGADPQQQAVARCRERLLDSCKARIDRSADGVCDASLRILAGDLDHGCWSALEVERSAIGAGQTSEIPDLVSEIATLGRTATLLRVARWIYGSPASYLAAWSEVRDRRHQVSERLCTMRSGPRRVADVPGHDAWTMNRKPLHGWVEFHEIVEFGGFDLVRQSTPRIE